ncbi:MAG TPA: electron transfer flavoprotein [Nitrososphaeraceae archaeon]|nr:electron transfer flavoprotein [Nitrososphaeraceae archaeon]
MENCDVTIVGGGSAGLAALKHLSSLGKQAILLEAGKEIGSKNVSGGILYSKKSNNGKIYNVEDIYGEGFLNESPYERLITKYILNATSKDKIYSIDLTESHDYQTNFGVSVLLNKLNSWFAKEAQSVAEKLGGGIITGVHVRSLRWNEKSSKIIVETDELEEFETKVMIAADGVNSEIAELTNAREKFSPSELYQGVKVLVKLPEKIIEERFNITNSDEGAAYLFAGDVSLNLIGGGFVYTNRDSLSIGGVYHYDSLLEHPIEPAEIVNAMLRNTLISELIKDDVPLKEIDKTLPKEEQVRKSFAITKLLNNWNELRQLYYSHKSKKKSIEDRKYTSEDEIKSKLDNLTQKLTDEYHTKFMTNYIELEYTTKLVPDGKRGRMKKPYYKNILFIGDAAGRGLFIGPRIEGLNVGIDDAARASIAIAGSLDKNNFESNYLGELYSQSIEQSPYTIDMKEIDKQYLSVILNSTRKKISSDALGFKHKLFFNLISNQGLRNFFVSLINKYGYTRLLSFIESEDVYYKIPIKIADKLGTVKSSTYIPRIPTVQDRVAKLCYHEDTISHIKILNSGKNFLKKMVTLCPTKCYSLEGNDVILQHEGCIECGTCSKETDWRHPRGEKGVIFKYG